MCCDEAIYAVPYPFIVLIFDILIPGFGTIIQSYMFHGKRKQAQSGFYFNPDFWAFWCGVLQLISAPLLIGWVWSIWHGWKVYCISTQP